MRTRERQGLVCKATLTLTAALWLGCGGGETAIVGIGNSGNHQGPKDLAEEIAKAFLDTGAAPEISDQLIASLYQTVLQQAREGQPEATLVILEMAKRQREEAEGED